MFGKKNPRKVLRVRVQHIEMDNAAIDGLWVGEYQGFIHLRAARTLIEGQERPIRHDEVLIPVTKVLYMEVLGSDANPDPAVHEIGEPAQAQPS